MAATVDEDIPQQPEDKEAELREARERAVEYGQRVLAGEEPWKDEEADVNDTAPESDEDTAGDTTTDAGEVETPKNDDVGETDSDAPDAIEVDETVDEQPVPTE